MGNKEILFRNKGVALPSKLNLNKINLEVLKNNIIIDNKDLEIKCELFRMIEISEYHRKKKVLLSVLNEVINNPKLKNIVKILEFLEVSLYSFENYYDNDFFLKPKEGYILKRCKSKKILSCFQYLCCSNSPCCKLWVRKWFVLKDDMIFYLDSSFSNIGKDVKIMLSLDFLV